MVKLSAFFTTQRIALAVVASLAIPAVTSGYIIRSTDTSVEAEIRREAYGDRTRQRRELMNYWENVQTYEELGNEAPELNPKDALMDGSLNLHKAAYIGPDDDLSADERALIRRYAEEGYCPPSLKRSAVTDLYERCLRLAEEYDGLITTGYIQTSEDTLRAVEQKKMPNFKLRMEMLKQALDRSTRRTETEPSLSRDRVYWWEHDIDED